MQINHVAIVTRSEESATAFLRDFLGFTPHERSGWYRIGTSGTLVHVIPIDEAEVPPAEELHHYYRHVAIEVVSIRTLAGLALQRGYKSFQMDMNGNEHAIERPDDPLTFGLRTLFVRDQDGNLWEFLERGHSEPALFQP